MAGNIYKPEDFLVYETYIWEYFAMNVTSGKTHGIGSIEGKNEFAAWVGSNYQRKA